MSRGRGPRARLRWRRLRACGLLRGRVGLSNGGVHLLWPAVGLGRPEEPPAAVYAAGRRPGRSAWPASASGVGGRAAGLSAALARPECLAGHSGEAGSQEFEPALRQLRSAPARVLGRPGPASWLPASAPGAWWGSPRAARCRPGRGSTLPGSFWVRGIPFKCTFASRELSSGGKCFGAPA